MILDDYYKGKIRKKLIKQYVKYSKIECWYWIGEIQKNGYGYIKLTNYNTSAYKRIHRVAAWIWLDFDLDSNLHILHKCNNKACLNPDHLYIGTHQDNMNDRKNNGNYKGIKGTKNFNAKLCNEDIKEIFELYNSKLFSQKEIAEIYKISRSMICSILKRKSWSHVKL